MLEKFKKSDEAGVSVREGPIRLLLVDDDYNVAKAFERSLSDQFEIAIAHSGQVGLEKLRKGRGFDVIISDLKMPEMNGIEFLKIAHELAPDSIGILLTGFADVASAISAVNDDAVSQFLTKPVSTERLSFVIEKAVEKSAANGAEKRLHDGSVAGAIRIFIEMIAAIDMEASQRTERVQVLIADLAERMNVGDQASLANAAALMHLGATVVSPVTRAKLMSRAEMSELEIKEYQDIPSKSAELLKNIPRLSTVSNIIQEMMDFLRHGKTSSREAQILALANAYIDVCIETGRGGRAVFDAALRKLPKLDPEIRIGFKRQVLYNEGRRRMEPSDDTRDSFEVSTVQPGYVLLDDVVASDGRVVVEGGTVLTDSHLERIKNYAEFLGIKEPIRCRPGRE